ncbi:hypothetical protein K1719_033265 [Acacia pycnantha]|nr:hypothetical protein K1719_033265 [Acacia pycnantha]
MNLLIWNSRGTGAKSFPALVRDLKTHYQLNFIAILETRCNKEVSHRRANLLGFPNMELVDCEGYSGGIWCLWDHSITSISVIERHHQFLHLQVTGAAGSSWVITVIYASPSGVARRALWDNLSRLATSIQGAWLIGGDLNGTLLLGERRSSATFRSSVDRELVSWVDMHEMRDVGFAGLNLHGSEGLLRRDLTGCLQMISGSLNIPMRQLPICLSLNLIIGLY